jgi:hypothetical protein
MEFWVQVIFTIILLKGGNNKKNIKRRTLAGMLKNLILFCGECIWLNFFFCVCIFLELFSKECYISLLSLKIFVRINVFFCNRWWSQQIIYMKCILYLLFVLPACIFPHFIWLSIKNFQFWFMALLQILLYLFIYGQSNFFTSMKTKIIIKSFSFFFFFKYL